jgi:hypothetical protein
MITDCDDCKRPCLCPNSDYYPISQIRLCRPQLFFLIEHLEMISEGIYPRESKESGYVDSVIQRQPPQAAPFEAPCQISAEIEVRIKNCKQDGQTLVHEIQALHADYYELLSPAARNALNYCAGFRRRRVKYFIFLKEQKRKRKIHQKV